MTARAVPNWFKYSSIERVPRTVVAINAPIDESEIATMASATSTSISVKPAVVGLTAVERDNFDPSRQPIDPDLVTGTQPTQCNGAAAGHPRREKANRGSRRVSITS